MGAIKKAEQARFAYLLNVLVSLPPPPPTWPVDCLSYFSICNKQLGNYYCHNQINNSYCDVATIQQNLLTCPQENTKEFMDLVLLGWTALVSFSFFSSGAMLSLSFFSVSTPDFFIPPSLLPLSRTFMKGELVWWRQCGPAWTPALLSASVHQSFFCCSFFLIRFGLKQVHSFSLIGFVYCVCVCVSKRVCVLKHNLDLIPSLPFQGLTLESTTLEKSMQNVWSLKVFLFCRLLI